jgi:tRNA (guanosine-2'-O-)-methyltransferase
MLQNNDAIVTDIQELVDYLSQFVTAKRYSRFLELVRYRTRFLTIVLEDIFQPHNASAVLRTCDCFGIQDVHIIEKRNPYRISQDIALGSSQWLSIHKYSGDEGNSLECLKRLKSKGYRLVATTPHKNDFRPENLPLDQKTALIFGTELQGLSRTAMDMADDYLIIPMVGFTESLNISVSAATLLYTLSNRIRNSEVEWQLNAQEIPEVLLGWLRNSIKHSDKVIEIFKNQKIANP